MLAALASVSLSLNRTVSCKVNKQTNKIELFEGSQEGDAYAIYDDDINKTGWYKLYVVGNSNSNEHDMMRCAGAVEGHISRNDINNHFKLICDMKGWNRDAQSDEERYPVAWANFLKKNYRYMNQSIRAYPEVEYWQTVGLIFEQFNGLVEGYKYEMNESNYMSVLDHWALQSQGDLGDTSHVLDRYSKGPTGPTSPKAPKLQKVIPNEDLPYGDPESLGDHCTGLIKIEDGFKDIWVAHDAWSDFRDLHGALKEYTLPCHQFNATKISMSTRAGKLSSYDDFYLADNGLMVIETTMTVLNNDLYEFVKPENIYTWFRAIHTMWTAGDGKTWTDTFVKHNSGTYNNQYLIVDTKKFVRGVKPEKDLLWVVEQYPGPHTMAADITEQLVKDGYFPSINKPHFKELYKIAGYPQKVKAGGAAGDFYAYEENARFQIIAREAPRLKNFEDFKAFMQYNNWQRDPYSRGDSSQQIMSRYDLRRPGCEYGAAKAFGGLDTKAMRLTEVITTMNFHAIASPAHANGNKIWVFDEDFPSRYDGLPREWNFSWTQFRSLTFNACNTSDKSECLDRPMCGWCTYDSTCRGGGKEGPFGDFVCEAGWETKTVLQSWALPVIISCCVIVVIFVGIVYGVHFANRRKNSLL